MQAPNRHRENSRVISHLGSAESDHYVMEPGRPGPYTAGVRHARNAGRISWHGVARFPWLVVLVAAAFAVLGYVVSSQQPERYTAVTRLFLAISSSFDGVGQADFISNPDRYAINQATLATSSPVLDRAIRTADLDTDIKELRRALTVAAGRGTDVIVIEATRDSPTEAAQWANAVADAYRAFKLDEVERQTEELTALSTNEEDRAAVLKRAAVYGDGIELTEVAEPPSEPSAPQPVRDALLALLVGTGLGIAAAVGMDALLARRQRSAAQKVADRGKKAAPRTTRLEQRRRERPGSQPSVSDTAASLADPTEAGRHGGQTRRDETAEVGAG